MPFPVFLNGRPALCRRKGHPLDIYNLATRAHTVIKSLGDEGLAAFNDPNGEFVYKDTYVYVLECPAHVVAHPFALEQLKGKDLRPLYAHHDVICQGAQEPYGSWVEYLWPKPGEAEPSRKITFVIRVEGTPYQVAAGIYDDTISIEEFNRKFR